MPRISKSQESPLRQDRVNYPSRSCVAAWTPPQMRSRNWPSTFLVLVATSRNVSQSLADLVKTASVSRVLVDGDIGKQETPPRKSVEAAIKHFGTIDVLVNNV